MSVRAAAALAALLTGCSGRGDAPPRHLVLVTLDTLRRDRCGPYTDGPSLTPNLDRLAARGVVFEDALCQAVSTPPSHASILTGLDPVHHGLRRLWDERLAPERTTLAEILHGQGFTTAAFVSALPLRREVGLDQGFERYDDELPPGGYERSAHMTNARVRRWLEDRGPREPLFLWVHFFEPHAPYWPPPEFRERAGVGDARPDELLPTVDANAEADPAFDPGAVARMRELYDGEVACTDAALGELLAILDEAGVLDDALLAVVADHGEHLGEHGYFFGHWNVLEETARIPMLLADPHGRFAGTRVPGPTATTDLAPTLLAWLGVEALGPFDGLDLTARIAGGPVEERAIVTEQVEYFEARAAREGRYALVESVEEGRTQRILYERSLVDDRLRAAAAAAAPAALVDALDRSAGGAVADRVEPSPDVAAGLRALGYGGGGD